MAARQTTKSKTTIDHDEIRRWVESKGGAPAHVKTTGRGKEPGILRVDFPGFSGDRTLEKLSWDQWFDAFDKNGLAFIYQPSTRFSKLVSRDTVGAKGGRTRATPRRATGAKRATAKRATAKRGAAKKKTGETARRGATAGRGTAKRTTAKRRSTAAERGAPKRGAVKRGATKRAGAAKRTGAKRGSKRPSAR
jgi:hypothetical protein